MLVDNALVTPSETLGGLRRNWRIFTRWDNGEWAHNGCLATRSRFGIRIPLYTFCYIAQFCNFCMFFYRRLHMRSTTLLLDTNDYHSSLQPTNCWFRRRSAYNAAHKRQTHHRSNDRSPRNGTYQLNRTWNQKRIFRELKLSVHNIFINPMIWSSAKRRSVALKAVFGLKQALDYCLCHGTCSTKA